VRRARIISVPRSSHGVSLHMNNASHHTAKKTFALVLVAAAVLLLAFAAVAAASPGSGEICSDCHAGVGTAPTVTFTTAGSTNTYNVTQTSTAWAAFDLSTNANRIGGGSGTTGTFTAPAADFVRVCAADGSSTGTWTQAYIVSPTAKAGGAISPVANEVVAKGGTSKVYTITANAGYHIADVTINGTSNAAAKAAGSYQAANMTGDVAIVATFAQAVSNFTITPTAGTGGTISPATPQTVAGGASATFTVTPKAGYQVATLSVDGTPVANAASYTFSNVTAAHAIAVTFVKPSLSLALSGLKSGALKLHKAITCKGAVKPARAGKATVTFQHKVGSKWVKVAAKPVALNATSGAYSIKYTPAKKGSWRIQTSVAKTSLLAPAMSTWKTFKVT
jgi:hypothetical protein